MKISLDEVAKTIKLSSDGLTYYWKTDSGEIIMYADPMFTGIVDEELEADLKTCAEKYIRIPGKNEMNRYEMLENFIATLPSGALRHKLEAAIHGKSAIRRCKDIIADSAVKQDWKDYETDAYKKAAAQWCKAHGIEYT